MPNWKKVITSGSDASLNSLLVTNGITGSLLGTASYATQATTAYTASYVLNAVSASYVLSSSYALTASFIDAGFY
jgi:hypothetical protein